MERDNAISASPLFIDDTVMRVFYQRKDRNQCVATFTHDVWLILMNYPMECWDLDTIVTFVAQYGRLLVWNKDISNRA